MPISRLFSSRFSVIITYHLQTALCGIVTRCGYASQLSAGIRSTTLAAKYRRDSSDRRSDTFSHKLCSRRFFGYLISCGSGLFYARKPFEHKITAEAGAVGPFVNFPSLRVLLFPRETDPFMAEARAMCENKFAQLVFFFASDVESFSGVE